MSLYTTIKAWDWNKIPVGSKFTCLIKGKKTSGRIQKEGKDIYLCQDVENGVMCDDKLGYKFSWSIMSGSITHIEYNGVKELEIELDPDYKSPIQWGQLGEYTVTIYDDFIKVGCTKVTKTQIEDILRTLKLRNITPKRAR